MSIRLLKKNNEVDVFSVKVDGQKSCLGSGCHKAGMRPFKQFVEGSLGHPQQLTDPDGREIPAPRSVIARVAGQAQQGTGFRNVVHKALMVVVAA
jgi:hypothetical protein